MGRLLRFLTLVTSLRIKDIELRRVSRQERREQRKRKEEEKIAREEKRNTDKNDYISALEQGVEFNEEEFQAQWIQANPEIEIPPEVQDENDLDFETIVNSP